MTKRVDKIDTEEAEKTEGDDSVDSASKEPELIACVLMFNPIKSYGKEIRVIQMRRPNGNDLLQVGNPVIYYPHVSPPKIEFDLPRVLSMVARLADPPIPSPSLADMDPRDIVNVGWELAPFFIPAMSRPR